MARRVRKFKLQETAGVSVSYEKPNASDPDLFDEYSLKSADDPTTELKEALQRMAHHVREICELGPDLSDVRAVRVIGITVTYTDDIQGLVISALRSLENSNSPMVINTPHFSREPYSPTAPELNVFSSRCADDLDKLEKLILAYVDGDRAQQELFHVEDDEPEVAIG